MGEVYLSETDVRRFDRLEDLLDRLCGLLEKQVESQAKKEEINKEFHDSFCYLRVGQCKYAKLNSEGRCVYWHGGCTLI